MPVDTDKIIESGFRGFHEAAFPNAPKEQIDQIRPIFFAGARLVVHLLSLKIDDDQAVLSQMNVELEAFGKWFALNIPTKGNA